MKPFSFVVVLFAMTIPSLGFADESFDTPIASSSTSSSNSEEAKPPRALMITGGCCHDYQNQKQIISEGLSSRVGPIDWTILQYSDSRDVKADIYRSADWIKDFDIVVHNECFGGVTDGDFVEGIVGAHKKFNVPAIVVHCSMHSYRKAPTADVWREFLGVTSVRHEKQKRSLTVKHAIDQRDNPILASLGGNPWTTPNGELYIIEKQWPTINVLATAHSNETESEHPVIWTNELGSLKIFGISLGHHNETMLDEKWQSVVAAGWKWAMK